jgi:hypothetical protein
MGLLPFGGPPALTVAGPVDLLAANVENSPILKFACILTTESIYFSEMYIKREISHGR